MEITLPDTVQFQTWDADSNMNVFMCFRHAVQAVVNNNTLIHCRLSEAYNLYCDGCARERDERG